MKKNSYDIEDPKMDEGPGEILPRSKPNKKYEMEPLPPSKPGKKDDIELIPPSKPSNPNQKYNAGGKVGSASKRADGCAIKGKTRGKMV